MFKFVVVVSQFACSVILQLAGCKSNYHEDKCKEDNPLNKHNKAVKYCSPICFFCVMVNPYPIFWDRHRARFLEKSKILACEVTVGTKNMKLYVQIECQLGYLMMLI